MNHLIYTGAMKTLIRSLLIATLAVSGVSAVSAQGIRQEAPVTVRVTSPANGATVGRSVTFTGTARPDVGLAVLIDGNVYIPPQDRGATEGRDGSPAGSADAGGRFSFTINLSGQAVQEAEGAAVHTVPAGRHSFVVSELYVPEAGQSTPITLTVSDGAATQTEEAATSAPSPTPTPTPSPTASPLALDESGGIDWPKLALAAVLGGLAGYGFNRLYQRRKK